MEASGRRMYRPPHVLLGLDQFVPPAKAREAILNGLPSYHGKKIKYSLRNVAIILYNHQKLSRYLQHNGEVATDDNTPHPFKNLTQTPLLPLCHWEALYYAIIAEIRRIYRQIQACFETHFANGALVLHTHGWDGTTQNDPFTVLDYASRLEEFWLLLIDTRLLGPLENAVRVETVARQFRTTLPADVHREQLMEEWNMLSEEELTLHLNWVQGMLDTNQLTPEAITEKLWEVYAPKIERACFETYQVEISLSVRRADLRERVPAPIEEIPTTHFLYCICNDDCSCRVVCQYEFSSCQCAEARRDVGFEVIEQQNIHNEVMQSLTPSKRNAAPNNFLGAVTNDLAQMQVAAHARPDNPYIVRAVYASKNAYEQMDAQMLHQRRFLQPPYQPRLIDVPKAPKRRTKDKAPLDFYNDITGGRYPRLQQSSRQRPQTPVYEQSTNPPPIPPRRRPIGPHPPAPRTNTNVQEVEGRSPYPPPLAAASKLRNVKSVSAFPVRDAYTSSAQPPPLPGTIDVVENYHGTTNLATRNAGGSNAGSNTTGGYGTGGFVTKLEPAADEEFTSPAIRGTLPVKNFGKRAGKEAATPYPSFAQPVTPVKPASYRGDSETPTQISAGSISPDGDANTSLPLPTFIDPPRADKQRYVQAGGNAKLADRESIPDFALPGALAPGVAMHKDELMKKIEEANLFYGKPPSAKASPAGINSPAGGSKLGGGMRVFSRKKGSPSEKEGFKEIEDAMLGEKRDRADSGNSVRNKIKRIFSGGKFGESPF